ncbi:MAG: hypothetical protein ACK5VX_04920, partial [Akkermansiaceae bacterium]
MQLTLGWKSGDEQKTAEIESVAVYAHESYLKHFAATKEKPSRETYSDKAALAQVADLALIEFQARKPGAELAIATIADALPPLDGTSKATLLALQGFCGVQSAEDQEAKKKPAFLDGGRSLSATWQPYVLRGYLTDVFKSTSDRPFLKRAGINDLDDPRGEKYSQRLAKLRSIRKYVYRIDVLERSLDYDEVTEIFVRVNSLGAKLRSSDLALAQITAKWRNSLATFQDFQKQCRKDGFELDLGIHLKN